jgi:hypothetical protein
VIWSKDKNLRGDKNLKQVEESLTSYYDSGGFGYNSENQKEEIKHHEFKRR